ncbi:unnamed protein product, partial [Ectocarpus sp. 12 AP-2014]
MFCTSKQTLTVTRTHAHTHTHAHHRKPRHEKDCWPALLKEHDRRGSSSAGGVAPFTHTTRQGRIKKILYSRQRRRRRRRARKKRIEYIDSTVFHSSLHVVYTGKPDKNGGKP